MATNSINYGYISSVCLHYIKHDEHITDAPDSDPLSANRSSTNNTEMAYVEFATTKMAIPNKLKQLYKK